MHLQLFLAHLLSVFITEALGGSYTTTSSRRNSLSMILGQCTNRCTRFCVSFQRNSKPCTKAAVRHFSKNALYQSSALNAVPEKRKSFTISDTDLSHVKDWFTLNLPEGVCVGVTTAVEYQSKESDAPEILSLSSALHDEEYDWGRENMISDASRTSFYLGRISLRSSMYEMLSKQNNEESDEIWEQVHNNPIRKDNFGRPILPNTVLGSISHKCEYAVGLSRLCHDGTSCSTTDSKSMHIKWREECRIFPEEEDEESITMSGSGLTNLSSVVGIGVDIERIHDDRSKKIQRKVLTEQERNELGALKKIGISEMEEVMLRFSLKESVYKAMHPILCDYVGLQEAEIDPLADGTAVVRLNFLKDRPGSVSPRAHSMVVQSATWRKVDGFFLTSASVGLERDT